MGAISVNPGPYLTSFLGWTFLPSLATTIIQRTYFRVTNQPFVGNSPPVQRQRRNIYVFVVAAYLSYCVYASYMAIVGDMDPLEGKLGIYSVLGVEPDIEEKGLKTVFRRLSVKHHPDKVNGSVADAEEAWIRLKTGYDVVINPVLRFGYDRLGSVVIKWLRNSGDDLSKAGLATVREVVYKGVRKSLVYYAVSVFFSEVLAFFKVANVGRMWKSYIMVCGLVAELWIMTRSTKGTLILGLLPFQVIKLLRRLSILVLIAINQLTPQFQGPTRTVEAEMTRLAALVDQAAEIVDKQISVERAPFVDDMAGLKNKLQHAVVENNILNDLEVADAMNQFRGIAEARVREEIKKCDSLPSHSL